MRLEDEECRTDGWLVMTLVKLGLPDLKHKEWNQSNIRCRGPKRLIKESSHNLATEGPFLRCGHDAFTHRQCGRSDLLRMVKAKGLRLCP